MVGVGAKGARRPLIVIRTFRDLVGTSTLPRKDCSACWSQPRGREPKTRRRRLISVFAGQGPSSQPNRPRRPLASALTHQIVKGLWAPGTEGGSRRLPGGAEGIRTPSPCTTISNPRQTRPRRCTDRATNLIRGPKTPHSRDSDKSTIGPWFGPGVSRFQSRGSPTKTTPRTAGMRK
jgi:hypothetical protein